MRIVEHLRVVADRMSFMNSRDVSSLNTTERQIAIGEKLHAPRIVYRGESGAASRRNLCRGVVNPLVLHVIVI